MIILLSPAKTVDFSSPIKVNPPSNITFPVESSELICILKNYSIPALMELMSISRDLAEVNFERIQNWKLPFNLTHAQNAIYAFRGEAYNGFNASTLSKTELLNAQKQLIILSGLYGILHPLDAILPYRLEMGTKLHNSNGNNLYSFWRSKITKQINELINKNKVQVIVNLASDEYYKSIIKSELQAKVITPQFLDFSNGKYKTVSVFAKKARGAMARFLIGSEIVSHKDIIAFQSLGYHYDVAQSIEETPVFIR